MQSLSTIENNIRNYAICLFAMFFASTPIQVHAGGVCVVAKELGDSLAIEWIAGKNETINSATEKAKEMLREKGFTKRKLMDLHVQSSTNLQLGYVIIIKSTYMTVLKKERTSYGCGFSPVSSAVAEKAAVKNLRSYSWGWKEEFGYELHARHEF